MDISLPYFGIATELTPTLSLASASRHLGWALTLGAVLLFLLKPLPSILRLCISAAAFIACIVPASWSLTHPLGLAYQTPSLVTQGIALLYLLQFTQNSRSTGLLDYRNGPRWATSLLVMVIVTGWALFLDTFAVLPVQLYALGYGPGVPLFGLTVAVILWGVSRLGNQDTQRHTEGLAVVLLAAIVIFALTRLPSGNAWDAMLDPWLWIAAHAALFIRGMSRIVRRDRLMPL